MKRDLQNREDIIILVNSFYNHVKRDKVLGPIFNDVAGVNWNQHLPKMYDFWETVIFHKASYKGDTLGVHIKLDEMSKLTGDHFQHWIQLFTVTANELFEGPNIQVAINKANSIATVLQIKLHSPVD